MESAKQTASCNMDIKSQLISRYQETSKSDENSSADSNPVNKKVSSSDDILVTTHELYMKAKSEGDFSEAAKHFTSTFNDILRCNDSVDGQANEMTLVANQMKEEMRSLLTELKAQYLRLKASPNPSSPISRQASFIRLSPHLSPRSRMSSEDRSISRDSVLRLNVHQSSSNKSLFYQQLYENLSQDMKMDLMTYFVENSDNSFERCRLMILAVTLSHNIAASLGPKLIQALLELVDTNPEKTQIGEKLLSVRHPGVRTYATSLLILDAIPLLLSVEKSLVTNIDLNELFQLAFGYYFEHCLENVANEYEFDELHEGLKKSIAARILGKDMSSFPDENGEDNICIALDCMFEAFIYEYSSESSTQALLKELRLLINGSSARKLYTFNQIKPIINKLELEPDIPEAILFSKNTDNIVRGSQTISNPPPKVRGRPKKTQASVIVSSDDGIKQHLLSKSREATFVFYLVLQHMFNHCSNYLRQTRSRVLINFDNPLAVDIEIELQKSQRSSRSKNVNPDNTNHASKRIKYENHNSNSKLTDEAHLRDTHLEESSFKSEQSSKVDLDIIAHLRQIQECLHFFNSSSSTISRLWQRFLTTNKCNDRRWYSRVLADSLILSGQYQDAIETIKRVLCSNQDELKIKKELNDSELSTLTVTTGTMPSVEVIHLRVMVQLISCYTLIRDKQKTFDCIEELMAKIKQSGLLKNDENYSSGNIIEEYRVFFAKDPKEDRIGYLFFDTLSMIRYVVNILMGILALYIGPTASVTDTAIGHTIVLSQVDWPKESLIYKQCIDWIRSNKPTSTTPHCLSSLTKFTYTDFFHYIYDPNILEDFTALLNKGYTLDIKSRQTSSINVRDGSNQINASTTSSRSSGSLPTRTGKAITTRGINKTFKEDLKVALIAQMRNSTNLIPLALITEFIQIALVPYLKANSIPHRACQR